MDIKDFNTKRRTVEYMNWLKKLLKNSRDYLPRVEVGDILLVLEPLDFKVVTKLYGGVLEESLSKRYRYVRERPVVVTRIRDNETWDYHPPRGDRDLFVRLDRGNFSPIEKDIYVNEEVTGSRSYVFLPNPDLLLDFIKLMPALRPNVRSRNRLKETLINHYKRLSK